MTNRSDDQHASCEIIKISRRGNVGDRVVAYPEIEAKVRADAGDDPRDSGIVADHADHVIGHSAREDMPQMNASQLDALGRFRRSVCDIDQFVSQYAHATGRASRKHDNASAPDRVQDVVLDFRRDKKRLDGNSVSLQTLKTIAAYDDRSQGER